MIRIFTTKIMRAAYEEVEKTDEPRAFVWPARLVPAIRGGVGMHFLRVRNGAADVALVRAEPVML